MFTRVVQQAPKVVIKGPETLLNFFAITKFSFKAAKIIHSFKVLTSVSNITLAMAVYALETNVNHVFKKNTVAK